MGRLSLVIADLDRDYLSKLEKFLMVSYPQRFDIYSFSSHNKLSEFLNCPEKRDILLVSSILFKHGFNLKNIETVILLKDDGPVTAPVGMEAVRKYQHAETLITDILRLHAAKCSKNAAIHGHGPTRTASFLSPAGGTGKSSIAAGCSILLAQKGLKTFYLNLEDIPSTSAFFNCESSQSFSNVIYHLKGKGGNLGLKLEGARCCDPETGVYYFAPPENVLELDELTPAEVSLLLSELRSSGLYDVVLIDTPAGLGMRNNVVISNSDVVLMVLAADMTTEVKTNAMLKGLDIQKAKSGDGIPEKLVPVYNRCEVGSAAANRIRFSPGEGFSFLVDPGIEIREFSNLNEIGIHRGIAGETAFLSCLGGILGHIVPAAGENTLFRPGNGFSSADVNSSGYGFISGGGYSA